MAPIDEQSHPIASKAVVYKSVDIDPPIHKTDRDVVWNEERSGPALALLLAGPALSIPSILVIRSVLGNLKTVTFVVIVVIMSTIAGVGYGRLFPQNPVLRASSATTTVAGTQLESYSPR